MVLYYNPDAVSGSKVCRRLAARWGGFRIPSLTQAAKGSVRDSLKGSRAATRNSKLRRIEPAFWGSALILFSFRAWSLDPKDDFSSDGALHGVRSTRPIGWTAQGPAVAGFLRWCFFESSQIHVAIFEFPSGIFHDLIPELSVPAPLDPAAESVPGKGASAALFPAASCFRIDVAGRAREGAPDPEPEELRPDGSAKQARPQTEAR